MNFWVYCASAMLGPLWIDGVSTRVQESSLNDLLDKCAVQNIVAQSLDRSSRNTVRTSVRRDLTGNSVDILIRVLDALQEEAKQCVSQSLKEEARGTYELINQSLAETVDDLKDMTEIIRRARDGVTTVSVAWIIGARAYVTWAGDSRVELTRSDARDAPFNWTGHTGDAANVILKSFCMAQPFSPDMSEFAISPGDIITIMSDGAESQLQYLVDEYRQGKFGSRLIEDAVEKAYWASTDDATIVACKRKA